MKPKKRLNPRSFLTVHGTDIMFERDGARVAAFVVTKWVGDDGFEGLPLRGYPCTEVEARAALADYIAHAHGRPYLGTPTTGTRPAWVTAEPEIVCTVIRLNKLRAGEPCGCASIYCPGK